MYDSDPFLERGSGPNPVLAAAKLKPWRTLLFLRAGTGLLLLVRHAVDGARGAFHFLWNEQPWTWVQALHQAGLPYAALLAPLLALLLLSISISFILGFLTRLFAALQLLLLGFLFMRLPASETALHGETLYLYALCSLTLLLFGSGQCSVDGLFSLGQAWSQRPQRRNSRP